MKQQLSCSSPLSFPVSFRQYTKVSKLACLEKHPFHLRFQILKDYPSKASSCFFPENVSDTRTGLSRNEARLSGSSPLLSVSDSLINLLIYSLRCMDNLLWARSWTRTW